MSSSFRKIVREVLIENNFVEITNKFDNLKWPLNNEQKLFLDYFITIEPDSLKEEDYKHASSVTKIPIQNLKSIVLTYGTFNEKEKLKNKLPGEFVQVGTISNDSRFLFGNKPFNAKEMDLDFCYRDDVVNFKNVSKEYSDYKKYPKLKYLPKNAPIIDKSHKRKEVEDNMIQLNKKFIKIKNQDKDYYKNILKSVKSDLDKLFL